MTSRLKVLLLALCVSMASSVLAQSDAKAAVKTGGDAANNPVAQVRNAQSWSFGPIANGGVGVGDRSDYKFFFVGGHVGKVMTPVLHAGIFSGQFEYGADVIPFWQAYTPSAHNVTQVIDGVTYNSRVGGGTYTGASLTPVIFRWNFLTRSNRVQPWFQAAGGLIYTTHKFPGVVEVPQGTPGGTSVWNFAPQGGVGVHYFLRQGRSVDFGLNAVHISSASLGDRNPGVNASLQFQVGYTFWK